MRVLGYEIIEKAGLVVKHTLGVLLLCWRRMARAGLVSGVAGFVLVEIVGSLLQQHFPAPVLTTIVALIFAMVVAYSVMLSVLIDEFIIGLIELIRVLEGDIQGGARAAAVAAERRAGGAGAGAGAGRGVFSAYEQRRETEANIDATEEFSNTSPHPRVNARPVPADQLPRIGWAMDQLERNEDTEASETLEFAASDRDDGGTPSRPLAASTSQPLVLDGQRSVWSRISKTLVGTVHPPLDEQQIDAVAED